MSSRRQLQEGSGLGQITRPVLVSVAIGILVCIGLLLLEAVVLTTQNIPQSMYSPMAIFAISAASLASGFSCAKILRHGGLMYGALTGAVMCAVVLLAGLAISDNGFGVPAVFKIVFIMLSAMLGGVVGVNTKKRRK